MTATSDVPRHDRQPRPAEPARHAHRRPLLVVGSCIAAFAVGPWTALAVSTSAGGSPPPPPPATATRDGQEQPSVPPLTVVPLDPLTVPRLATRWLSTSTRAVPASVGSLHPLPATALTALTPGEIPRTALAAYVRAAVREDAASPGCRLRWQVLAGIGEIESGHARDGGSSSPGWAGTANPPILGPLLDGTNGFAAVTDTDHGSLDGSRRWDRAVGPMQFLPSTWRRYAVDAHGGSSADPQNVFDAAAAAAHYLCVAGGDLTTPDGLIRAVYAYNHSLDYVDAVLSVAKHYAGVALPAADRALSVLPAVAVAAGRPLHTATPRPTADPARLPRRTFTATPEPRPTPTDTAASTGPAYAGPSASSASAPQPQPSATPASAPSPSPSPTPAGAPPPSPSPTPSPSPSDSPQSASPSSTVPPPGPTDSPSPSP